MTSSQDRRFEPRLPVKARGLVVAPGLELPCLILDQSVAGLRVRLERNLALPALVVIIDLAQAMALEADVVWCKGHEAGLKRRGQSALRGLVPSRLAAARAAWLKAAG